MGSVDWNVSNCVSSLSDICRSPCGECGLKSTIVPSIMNFLGSLPPTESVDWNIPIYESMINWGSVAPPRGAWIEICDLVSGHQYGAVAPYAGSVDWNCFQTFAGYRGQCRSPCGERGLKYNVIQRIIGRTIVAPLRGAWIEMHSSSVAAKPTASLPMWGAWIKICGSCQATITGNVSGWQTVHLWCYSLSDCDWRKGCGSIFKKTRWLKSRFFIAQTSSKTV